MEPVQYLRIFRQRWKLIAACLAAAFAAAWVTTPAHPSSSKPVTSYLATATLLQAPGTQAPLNYIALFVTTGDVPVAAAKQLNYHGNAAILASSISATPDPAVGSLAISSTGSDGPRAAQIANAFADQTQAYFRRQAQDERQKQIADAQARTDRFAKAVEVLSRAVNANPQDS